MTNQINEYFDNAVILWLSNPLKLVQELNSFFRLAVITVIIT